MLLKIKPRRLVKTAAGMILMAEAIRLLVKPVKELGAIDPNELTKKDDQTIDDGGAGEPTPLLQE